MLRRTPLKRTQKPLKRTKLSKGSKTLKRGFEAKNGQETNQMWELFELHWNTHPDKKCEACGKQLFGENLTVYHDHLLEKGVDRFEYLAYDIDNLFLCCWECHTAKGNGFPLPKHKAAIEAALKKHYERK